MRETRHIFLSKRWTALLVVVFALLSLFQAAWGAPAASAVTTTPPRIAGGKWPAFNIAGNFNPKQITNARLEALWTIDTKGRSQHIRLDKSSGSKPVDRAITSYVRALRFTPATKDGKPIAYPMQLPFDLSAK